MSACIGVILGHCSTSMPSPVRNSAHVDWAKLPDGDHNGKTLPQVLLSDPDFLFSVGPNHPRFSAVQPQALIISVRASNIIIPLIGGVKQDALYFMDKYDSKRFGQVILVAETKAVPPGFPPFERRDVLDLSMPRRLAPRDWDPGKKMLPLIKELFFKGANRLSRDTMHAFFNDTSKFCKLGPVPSF